MAVQYEAERQTNHQRVIDPPVYRVEQELRTYEQRHRTLFEQVSDAVYITTLDGRFVDINPAGLELFGYSRDELIGQPVEFLV